MKLLSSRKPHYSPTPRKSSKFAPFIALALLLTIPLYTFPPSHKLLLPLLLERNNNSNLPCSSLPCNDGGGGGLTLRRRELRLGKGNYSRNRKVGRPKEYLTRVSTATHNEEPGIIRTKVLEDQKCDLFTGEWVPNPQGPYYTNATCDAIQDHQNCMKYGRPDTGFLKWRWKPDGCDLPIFDPHQFLELVQGKSLAFVGDSVARNQMQSLICLLSRVAYPEDLSAPTDQNKRYQYTEHDFNISMFWSPYLVKTGKLDPNEKRPFDLYLDEFDPHWTTKIALFDYLIISAGHWFFRPTYFYVNNRRMGCLYCPESNISHMTSVFSYRRAFRTAFRAINGAVNFKGVTFLRTFAPSHFEGGPWDKGGNCVRKRPFKRKETSLRDFSLEMYLIQLEELKIARRAGRRNGGKFRLFDATKPMLLRPDGHPSKYGNWPVANQTFANDCVHWCLPGPIDSWNDFLQELLKRENKR
ncbi:protein trichome birefringence-like 19 [Sesamum indicum]|uniref:Protein trichome birefringence-like 19 n=1 Tax=Sesamum indicum TaxID=4182 RepID=A0A6I9UJV9_SESIN|nr:protein trichome birefringence-like 19 [Sesamum indicum]